MITVGGDGTLLAASHSVRDVPILGINSAPGYSVGFFCAAARSDLMPMIGAALAGKLRGRGPGSYGRSHQRPAAFPSAS